MFNPLLTACTTADALLARHAPPAAWQQRQRDRLRALVAAARRGSPWWAARLKGFRAEAADVVEMLAGVPVSNKRELMAEFGGWVTDPAITLAAAQAFLKQSGPSGEAWLNRYLVWESSGSSGDPAVFVQDDHALAVMDALEASRGPVAAAGGGLAPRVALVSAIDGPFASIVSLQRLRRLNPFVAASSRPMSFLQPLEALLRELHEWQPRVIATYPSMAWVLAQQQREGRLKLNLDAVWTGGETLSEGWRSAIADAFGCPVRDSYGASECMVIASECAEGAMHVNADWVILEPVDEQFRPLPFGAAPFTTLLTNLANRVQPILRYDIGDGVRFLHAHCACGSTMPIIRVQGRCDEVLTLGGRGRPVHLPPLALTTVLEDDASVFDFVLRPDGRGGLKLELFGADARDDGRGDRAVAALSRYLRSQGVAKPQITVVLRPGHAARGRSGKHARVCTRPAGGRARGAADEPS